MNLLSFLIFKIKGVDFDAKDYESTKRKVRETRGKIKDEVFSNSGKYM